MRVVETRAALLENLRSVEGAEDLVRRLAKCGRELMLRCSGCTAARPVRTRCDLKWCPSCQSALAARTTDRFKRVIDSAAVSWPLFVTFTVKHGAGDDWNLIRTVRRAHTKLRRLRWFKKCVRGGIVAFEAQNNDGGLHPHVHCLLDSRWFAVSQLEPRIGANREQWSRAAKRACMETAQQWNLCTDRQGSVKVRRVWSRDNGDIGGALAEVVKYSVCGADLARMDPPHAVELIRVLDRTRMLCSFGTLYRHPGIKRKRNTPAMCTCGCTEWLPEDVLVRQARGEHGW